MRVFLGLPWPEDRRAELERRAAVWQDRAALRLVAPGNWHVTLRFLGDLEEEAIPGVGQTLATWAKGRGPLTFVDRGWSWFGPASSPRVVLLKLEPLPLVARAIGLLHKALDAAGYPGDAKPWKPHLTLAYGQGGELGPWPEEPLGGRPPILFQRAVLYQSVLGAGGSTYTELIDVPLK